MLLKSQGRVAGYHEGQAPLIYLTTTVQRVMDAGCRFVFSDGHGLASFRTWYEDLEQLDQVDFEPRQRPLRGTSRMTTTANAASRLSSWSGSQWTGP